MKYAVLDTETTGVRPGTDRVIELAAAVYEAGKVTATLHGIHNPGLPIPAEASAVHGWTDERVAPMPAFEARHAKALLALLQATEGPVYVHNVAFDRDLLAGEFARVGVDPAELLALPWTCTLVMARELWPGLDNTLEAVAARLGVEPSGPAHLASTDVDTLARCVEQIVHRYAHRGHKGALVKATTPVPALAVSNSTEVLTMAATELRALEPRLQQAKDWVAGYSCDDDDDEALGHDGLGRIKKLQAEGDAKRKGVVEPIKAITAKVDQVFRDGLSKPCDELRATVEGKLATYGARKLQLQRQAEAEARRKLEAERAQAEAEAAEARRKQAEAEAAAKQAQAELERAELEARRAGDAEAVAKAEQARAEQALAAERARQQAEQAEQQRLARVHEAQAELVAATSDAGPVKTGAATGGYKTKWTATITDPGKVPDVYWRPDLELVQRAVDQGAREIPGCQITEQVVVSNRRKG